MSPRNSDAARTSPLPELFPTEWSLPTPELLAEESADEDDVETPMVDESCPQMSEECLKDWMEPAAE
jgi:hypothetical protein